jgi:DNA-binding transcriptional ArsR family regulator
MTARAASAPSSRSTGDVPAEQIGMVLAALADPTRRQLLDVLVDVGRASATSLAAHLPVTRQAVVKHLHVLENADLVVRLRVGREVLFSADTGPLDASARWLAELSSAWDNRLAALKQRAETAEAD